MNGSTEPIPMILLCPLCGERHIDTGEFETKPHHTHACQKCGNTWRPAIQPTVGVKFLPGFYNGDPDKVVYVLDEDDDFNGWRLLGIYGTKEAAERAKSELPERSRKYQNPDIEPMEAQ